jgi:DNA polymerase-3 subunit epsilon
MNKYIVCLDIETSGLNSKEDRIIQFAAIKIDKVTFEEVKSISHIIKPSGRYEISPQAFEKHGLTKEYIESNGILFGTIIDDILDMLNDSDILTYNGNTFDIKFLSEEFSRNGKEFPLENKRFYDAFAMECKFAPRDLVSVYKKYTGNDLEGAHNAFEDVKATIEVFKNQMGTRELNYEDIDLWNENNLISPEGSLRLAGSPNPNLLVFNIGKYKESEVIDIAKKDPGYMKWFLENVASNYTKKIIQAYYIKNKNRI